MHSSCLYHERFSRILGRPQASERVLISSRHKLGIQVKRSICLEQGVMLSGKMETWTVEMTNERCGCGSIFTMCFSRSLVIHLAINVVHHG